MSSKISLSRNYKGSSINRSTYWQDNGAAYEAGGLEVGQLILEVDGHKVEGNYLASIQRGIKLKLEIRSIRCVSPRQVSIIRR